MMILRLLVSAILLCLGGASADAGPPFQSGGVATAPTYTGPCDVGVTCAEAWGVDYAMTRNYTGPLFQLLRTSDSALRDVSQDRVTRKADLTGVSAWCGGTNCIYIKLYAQIHLAANDLVPRCYTSCGQTFLTIDSATNLPILDSSHNCCGGAYGMFDVRGVDGLMTGIPGGWSSAALFYLGTPLATDYCCSIYGLQHQYGVQYNVPGSDLGIGLVYGWIRYHCLTATSFCLGIEEEGLAEPNGVGNPAGGSAPTQYATTQFSNVFAAVTLDISVPSVTGFINGVQNWTFPRTDHADNYGRHLHFGSGGDGSTPDPYLGREFFVTNAALTLAQYQAIFANVKARYPALTFQAPTILP